MPSVVRQFIIMRAAPIAILLSSCGTQSAVGSSQVSGTGTPAFVGSLGHEMRYANARLTLTPPGVTTPGRPPSVAVDACASGRAVCFGDGATTVLALATLEGTGTMLADGRIEPLLKNRLTYVTTWTNLPCRPVSGNPGPGYQGKTDWSKDTCKAVSIVDANSGEALFGFSGNAD